MANVNAASANGNVPDRNGYAPCQNGAKGLLFTGIMIPSASRRLARSHLSIIFTEEKANHGKREKEDKDACIQEEHPQG